MTDNKQAHPFLDHPCKQTCSGWQQGYERGTARALALTKITTAGTHPPRKFLPLDYSIRGKRSHISEIEYLSLSEHTSLMAEKDRRIKIAEEYLNRIKGFCEHADEPSGELCECSTQMSIDAGKAIAAIRESREKK